MAFRFHAQAALDFMMTYGWALLIIFLIASTIMTLNIFDMNAFVGNKAVGFTQLSADAWRIQPNGALTLMLRNNAGTDVNVTGINATIERDSIGYSTPFQIMNGEKSGTINVGTFSGSIGQGNSYVLKVNITYTDLLTGSAYSDSGTIYGKVA